MKVTQQSEPKFIPVVITLESQEEVDIIYAIAGRIAGTGKVRKVVNTLYEALYTHKSNEYHDYFEGKLTINPY